MPAQPRPPEPKPRPARRANRPAGCVAETTSSVHTDLGDVVVRVRRYEVLDHVGGHAHPVPGVRIEVALSGPGARRFEVVEPHYLDRAWRQPSDDLAVHIEVGCWVEAEYERAVARPRLPSAPGMEEPPSPRPEPPPARPGRLTVVRRPRLTPAA